MFRGVTVVGPGKKSSDICLTQRPTIVSASCVPQLRASTRGLNTSRMPGSLRMDMLANLGRRCSGGGKLNTRSSWPSWIAFPRRRLAVHLCGWGRRRSRFDILIEDYITHQRWHLKQLSTVRRERASQIAEFVQTQKSPARCRALLLALCCGCLVTSSLLPSWQELLAAFFAAFFAGAFSSQLPSLRAFFAAFLTANFLPRLGGFADALASRSLLGYGLSAFCASGLLFSGGSSLRPS